MPPRTNGRIYSDRRAAGRALAAKLGAYKGRSDVLVLGLPRGGVPVAYEVARALGATLDVLIVRKLGLPAHPELAMGAIASGGAVDLNHEVMRRAGVREAQFQAVLADEQAELRRRELLYRGERPPIAVEDHIVIVVDDGVATGASLRVALSALRQLEPAKLVAAVPVAPDDAARAIGALADEFVCAHGSPDFGSVGQFYEDFGATGDDEVRTLLDRARQVRR